MIQPPYILDIYHDNVIPSFADAKQAGLAAVIHKTSQGTWMRDPLYRSRKQEVTGLGMLWGAYHFGELPNPRNQADIFLGIVGNDANTRICLDLEPNTQNNHGNMNLASAEEFLTYVQFVTGRWPMVYTADYYIKDIGGYESPVLAKCELWVAAPEAVPVVPKPWTKWTLWQFTNGEDGPFPHRLHGLGANDLNTSGLTLEELKAWWPQGQGEEIPVAEKKMVVNTGVLNVRKGTTTSATIVDKLPLATEVTVDPAKAVNQDGHVWYPIEGKYFVASEYLSDPK